MSEIVDNPVDAVFEQRFSEIDNQGEFEIQESQIGQGLNRKGLMVLTGCLAFDNNPIFNQKIETEFGRELQPD